MIPGSPVAGAFQTSEKMVSVFSHPQVTTLSLLGLFPSTQQCGASISLEGGASRVQVLGPLETGRVFLLLSHKG